VSRLLRHKTTITSVDYKDLIDSISASDLVYMDPPYQGTSQNRDPRYYSGLDFDELIDFLHELNTRQISFILSYDGRTDNKTYGRALPGTLNLHKLEIYAGRSSQATLLGKKANTYESLYLSPALTEKFPPPHLEKMLFMKQQINSPRQLELGIV
jgi:DNA adenine methylase